MNGNTASSSSTSTTATRDATTAMPGALPDTACDALSSESLSQLASESKDELPTVDVNGSPGVRDRDFEPAPRSPSARTKTSSPDAESWQPAALTTTALQGDSQRLSSSALAALQSESGLTKTAPPVRPPKSAARSQRSASIDQAVPVTQVDDPETSPDPASSPNVDSSATLTTTTPTIRAGLTHARPRPQVSTTLAATTARHSIASSSTNSSPYPSRRSAAYFTDDSDWTGGPTSSALETPSTTADYSASNSSSPAPAKGRPPPLPLDAQSKSGCGELAGLGLDFLAPPPPPPQSSSARTSFDEVDLDRGMERLSRYARTLPSPFPSVLAGTGASPMSDSPPEDRTLMLEPTAKPYASEPPPLPPLVRPFVSASEPTSPASSRLLPLLGVTATTSLSVSNSRDSALERLASPAVSGRAFESETDFFSTDFEAQTDADEYDEGDDSFSLYPVGGQRRMRQASAGSFQRAKSAPLDALTPGTSLWSEDMPNWEGALPRPGDGVVDWTECRLERQALPPDTTHLILARCQTPLHIAPLLSNSIGMLSQMLVVLDIGSCGLTEIPSAIGSCCFLEELDIHGNPLATGVLPPFIGTLPALNVLLADGCNLASLPDSLAQLTRLHTLTLRNNRLRTLPAWISRLTALEQLLVDGNPFHWQVHTLVQPLLQQATPASAIQPARQRSRSILSPHPPAPLRMESSPIVSTLAAIGALEPPSALSPPLASPALFRSAAASPAPSEEPQSSRSRATSFSNRLPTPDREDSAPPAVEGKRPKWGRLLKKVSTGRLRSSSSVSSSSKRPMPGARAVSQPVTRDEESDVEQQRSPSKSRSRPRAANRQSFLALKALGTVPPPPPQDQAAALKAVLAYLRDLDDLSPDMSLPTIPLDASSPALRHSPSLGALSPGGSHARSSSPGSLRRAQSSRRVPSTGSSAFRGSRASSITEDSPDPAFVPDDPKPKRVDDPVKRAAVIEEIITTEKSYLRGLQELCAIYVASAAAIISSSTTGATGKRDTVLPPSERRAVFGNVEAIRDFHSKILLPDLLAAGSAQDSHTVAGQIGRVFSEHVSFMKIYSSYINGFDDALARIQSWAKPTAIRSPLLPSPSSPAVGSLASYDAAAGIQSTLSSSQKKRIKSWLKRCRIHPAHSQISLESYLLLPIQRIPRYRMLLGTLAACTPSLSDDSPVEQAVRDLEGMATMLNESKRENEGRAQLIMWQNRLVSKFKSPLVQPHRTLLRSGAMTLVRSVKRTTTQLELPLPGSGADVPQSPSEEVSTLYTESKEMSLTGLLCNDLLVLVKMPPAPFDSDPNAPVELYTVLRLTGGRSALQGGHHRAKPPASLDGPDDLLRLKIGDKAVCYFRCAADPYKNRKEALAWTSAINLQWEVNT